MSEKLAEVYEQYDVEILGTKKGRGGAILTTSEGLRILEPFRGSITRLEQEYVLKQLFLKEGCTNVDVVIPNKDGMLFTCDKYRQPFVLKKHFEGNECDMHAPSDIVRAVKALAEFHLYGKKVVCDFGTAWVKRQQEKKQKRIEGIKQAVEAGEELEKISGMYDISLNVLEEVLKTGETEGLDSIFGGERDVSALEAAASEMVKHADSEMEDMLIRHNRELKKIQKYVSRVKKRNTFENLFLQVFSSYYTQGIACVEMLKKILQDKKGSSGKSIFNSHYGICHGAYNQHNIIIGGDSEAIVHFERFSRGNQLNDLYQFARKVMEKNHFDFGLLEQIFHTYGNIIEISEEDYYYIYILFSYPEKFWKIANSYYNTSKAFLSPKYVEKLNMVILQEKEKKEMLEEYFAFHLG